MRALMEDNHEDERGRARLAEQARSLSEELLASGVLERAGRARRSTAARSSSRPRCRTTSRSTSRWRRFAQAAFELLDPESETYALDVLSVVESILDDPFPVLMAQANKERGEAVAEMKADGIEYEERMELLEEVTYPRPLAEPLEQALRAVPRDPPVGARDRPLAEVGRARHVRVGAGRSPSSSSYYGVARSEGLVLRYLSDAYRALRQTVPERIRTDELDDIIEWLGETVRQIDSSLLDEWEALTDPDVRRARGGRGGRRRAARAAAPDHRQRARVPGDGPQRHVPEGAAGRARPLRRARPARDRRGGAQRPAGRATMTAAAWEERSATTGTSTRRSTPGPPRAHRSC